MPVFNHPIHSGLNLELPCQAKPAYLVIVFPVGSEKRKSCVSQIEVSPGERGNPMTPYCVDAGLPGVIKQRCVRSKEIGILRLRRVCLARHIECPDQQRI